ncbi:MAG: DUF2442 domain-containing protein [Planctomycetota bacterium]|nr:MAG: DUF2442 domain-containing protein [Planctomycetota bacterium]REK26512.1 MAG: DUF2442 domain-containing protein [Planctomycetota bacterium]REK33965.1 MAG: DUF2442 domain-containing protein [Planctomycetota bacterium]
MTSSTVDIQHVRVATLKITDDLLIAELSDGRTISAPLSWYPRLCHGTDEEREDWRLIGGGRGIHWTQLDEDISVENIVLGRPSTESQASLKRWLDNRNNHPSA